MAPVKGGAATWLGVSLAAAAWLAAGAPVSAQVLAIGDDGGVASFDGPAIYSSEGVTSLTPRQRAPKAAAPAPRAAVAAALGRSALQHGLDPALPEAVAWRESGFRQDAVSPKGAVGVMQLMPGTARALRVDAASLAQNIDGGVAYLASLVRRFRGDVSLALAAYNAGPETVARYGGVPPFPETKAYVNSILARLAAAPGNTLKVEAR